ncbi:MAG: PspC domain-containing protein [Bacteroidaceae bacterium]|nr:PspC domain-containing protein [Bacteroidaceae bacterium]
MKKNISINLFGTLYNIDEDAYNLLENYLQSMQRYFGRQEGGEEVADDIEHRVAELLWQRREAGMTAVNIETVKEIIDTIGNAEQIARESGDREQDAKSEGQYTKSSGRYARSQGQESSFKENLNQFANDANRFANDAGRFARDAYDKGYNHVKTHRYYRCANDKILGGVCSGMAVYTNAGDPLVWRLGAIALTLLGIGLPLPIIYIVMWLVTPAAITPEDRLRQQGKAITPENLTQQVMDDSEPIIVKNENKGCLKAILIIIGICIILPLIFFFVLWGKMFFNIFFNML